MAVDPKEIQRRLLQNGLNDANTRLGENQSLLRVAERDLEKTQTRISGIKAAIADAEQEIAAIKGLMGTNPVDPGS